MDYPKYLNCSECEIAIPFFKIKYLLESELAKRLFHYPPPYDFSVICPDCSDSDEDELVEMDYRM